LTRPPRTTVAMALQEKQKRKLAKAARRAAKPDGLC
jgi:hypothetical protein